MRLIDLNADLGEGAPYDQELLHLVSSASICCGGHAGSREVTLDTCRLGNQLGVRTGCHPGIPDRVSMGRAPIGEVNSEHFNQMVRSLLNQVAIAPGSWAYLKPHGSLYNESTIRRSSAFRLVNLLIMETRLPLMGLANSSHEDLARYGLIREGFLDRTYTQCGALVPRSESNAMLTEGRAALEQSLRLMDSVDSFCIHGDNPNAIDLARFVVSEWKQIGIGVARWS